MRPEVKGFAQALEVRLKENDRKGGWQGESDHDLFERLMENAFELYREARAGGEALKPACDVAAYAMMLADNNGDLEYEFEDEEAPLNLAELQKENRVWAERNFGCVPWWQPLMGLSEELGELNHALLKQEQGIRGNWGEHEAKAQDAVGDMVIYLLDLCNKRGWDLERIIRDTWDGVKDRDWKKDPMHGGQLSATGTPIDRGRRWA